MNNTSQPAQPNVLITGAAHRIGRAIALDLAANGYGVGVHYNNSEEAASKLVKILLIPVAVALRLRPTLPMKKRSNPLSRRWLMHWVRLRY